MTDLNGRVLVAAISPAALHNSHDAVALLQASHRSRPFLTCAVADLPCQGEWLGMATSVAVKVVSVNPNQKGFTVDPRRWAVTRTFGWLSPCHSLVRDREITCPVSAQLALAR